MSRLFDHDVAQPTRPKAQAKRRRDRVEGPELDAGAPRAIWAALLEHGADPAKLAALLRDGLPPSERRRAYLELVRDLGLERAQAVWTEAFRPSPRALPEKLRALARATEGSSLTAIHVVTGELVEVIGEQLATDPISRERARARTIVEAALGRAPKIARSGRALPSGLKHELAGKLGASLDDVRVHDDAEAAGEVRARGAVAFARGSDVYFADGRYRPETREGKHLLAHELAHVVQAKGAGGAAVSGVSDAGDPTVVSVAGASSARATEREAESVAQAITDGRAVPRVQAALRAEAHADEAAAQPAGPFHLTLATQSFTADLQSAQDLPNGQKRVTVSQTKIGPIVIDALDVVLDGAKVKEGTLHAHVDDGRFKGVQSTLHVDEHGRITGSLDVGVDVPGILVKHVSATLSESGLQVTLALEGGDFAMQEFPVTQPRMSITVAQTPAGLDVQLAGDVTVRLPPGFAEGQGTLTAQISTSSTGTTPGALATIAAKLAVPGLGLDAEATLRFDGKNISFEGAAASLPIDIPGLKGLAKIGYQPGQKISVEIPDLDFTLPSLKDKLKFSNIAIGGGKLSGTIAAPDGTELDFRGLKATLRDSSLTIDGKSLAGSLAGDLELTSGTKGSFQLSYSKEGGLDGDVTFDGKKFPLGGGEAVIDPGAHLHLASKDGVTGELAGSVQLGPIPKVSITLKRDDPAGPTQISAHTDVKLSQLVPSLEGDLSASYEGTLKSGRFHICVDNPGVKDLPGSRFLERIELAAGKGGFTGSAKALPGAKIDAKGHSFTVSEGHVSYAGGVLDGEVKGKVEGSVASGDVSVGWKHGKLSFEAEGEVDLGEATRGQVIGKVKGKTGSGKGTQLELIEPPGASFSNEKLKGLKITEITGDTNAKTFSIAVQGADLVNDLSKGLKSVDVKLDDAVARIEVQKGKLKIAAGVSGAATFKPGGKEVASGKFAVALDDNGFGGEVLVEHFSVSDKLKGRNLLVDLRSGLKSGEIDFNVDGVVSGQFRELQVQPKEGVFGFEGEAHFDQKLGSISKVGIHTKLASGVLTAEAKLEEGLQLEVPGGATLKLHAGESHAKLEQGHFSVHLAGESALPGDLATGQFHLDLEGKTLTGQVNAKTKKVGAFKEGTEVDLSWKNGSLEGDAHLELGAPFSEYFTSSSIDLHMHHREFSVAGTINGPIQKLGKLGETFKTATIGWDGKSKKVTGHAELNLETIPTFGAGSHARFELVDNKPEIHGHVKIGQLGSLKLDKNEISFDWVAKQGMHVKGEAAATIDGLGTVELTTDARTDEGAPKFSLDGKITGSLLAQKFKGVTFADPPSAKVTINNTDGKWDFGVDDLGTKITGIAGIDAVDIDFNAHWTKQKGLGCVAAVRKLQVKSFNFTGMLQVDQGKFQSGVLMCEADFPGVGLIGSIQVTPSEMHAPSIKASLTALPKGSGAIAKFVKSGHLDLDLQGGHLKKAEGKIDLNPPDFLQMKDASVAISYKEGGEIMGHLHAGFTVPLGDGIEGELDVWVGGKERFRLELGFPFTLPGFEESRVVGSINAAGEVKIAGQFKPKGLPFLKSAEIGIGYKNGFDIYGFVIIEPSPEHELKVGVRYDLARKQLVTEGIDYKEKESQAPAEPPLHKDLFNQKIPLFGVGVLNVVLTLRFGVGAALAKPKLKLDTPEIVGGLEAMDKGEMPEIRFGGDVGVGVDLSMEFGIGIAGQIQLLIAEADAGIEGVAKAVLNLMIGSKVKGSFKQGEGARLTIDPYVQATLKLLAELNAFFHAEVCWFTIIDKHWPLAGVELASIPLGELHPFKPLQLAVGGPEGTKLSTPELNLDVDQIVAGVKKGSSRLSDDQANEDARKKLKPVLQSMKAAAPQFERLPPNWREGMTAAPVSFDQMFHVPSDAWDFYREHADDAEQIDPADAMASPTERLAKAVAVLSKWNPYLAGMLVLSWRRAQIAHEGVNPDTGVDVVAEQKVVQEEQDRELQLEVAEAQAQQKAQDDEHARTVAKQGTDYAHAEAEHQKKDEKTRAEYAHRTHALEKEGQGAQAKLEAASKEADKAGVTDKPPPATAKALEKPPVEPPRLHRLEKPAPIPPKPPVPIPQPPPQVAKVALPALPQDPGVMPPATRPIPRVQKPMSVDTPAPNPQPQAPPPSQPQATSSATVKGGGGRPLEGAKAPSAPPAKSGGGGAPTPAPHVAAGAEGIISQQKTLDAKKAELDGKLKSHGGAGGAASGPAGTQPMKAPAGAAAPAAAGGQGDPKQKGKPGEKPAAAPLDPTVQKVVNAGKKDEEHQKKEAEKKQDAYKHKVGKSESEAGQAETHLVAATQKAKDAAAAAAATGAGAAAGNAAPKKRVRANIGDFPMPTPEEARVAYSNWLKLKLSGQTFLSFQEKLAMLQYFNFEKKTFSSVITEWETLSEKAGPGDVVPEPKLFAQKLFTGNVFDGKTFHRAAGYDPTYSLSDEALKALATLEKFKATYRGNKPGDYLVAEAEKLVDAAMTAFVQAVLEPIANALDAMRALRAALDRLGPHVEVQKKLAMVDAGKVDAPAFWTFLGTHFKTGGTGMEQVNAALDALEHTLKQSAPPSSQAAAAPSSEKPQAQKPVENRDKKPHLRVWAEVAPKFAALAADQALEQSLAAFGVHAGQPLEANQQGMLAVKRKELEALGKTMPGKSPEEVHAAWRKDAHARALAHNKLVLEVTRKYALLISQLREQEPRLDQDGVQHACAAFRQRVGSNTLLFAVPQLNPAACKPEEKVDAGLPLATAAGAAWNPLLTQAWLQSTFEAFDPAAGAKVAQPQPSPDAKQPHPQAGTHAEQASLAGAQPPGAKLSTSAAAAPAPNVLPAAQPIRRPFLMSGVSHTLIADPATKRVYMASEIGPLTDKAGKCKPLLPPSDKALVEQAEEIGKDIEHKLADPSLEKDGDSAQRAVITSEVGKDLVAAEDSLKKLSLSDLGSHVVADAQKTNAPENAQPQQSVAQQADPKTLAQLPDAELDRRAQLLKTKADEEMRDNEKKSRDLTGQIFGAPFFNHEGRLIIGAGFAAVQNVATLPDRTNVIGVGFPEPWYQRGDLAMGQAPNILDVSGFVTRPWAYRDNADKRKQKYLASEDFGRSIAQTQHAMNFRVARGWAGQIECFDDLTPEQRKDWKFEKLKYRLTVTGEGSTKVYCERIDIASGPGPGRKLSTEQLNSDNERKLNETARPYSVHVAGNDYSKVADGGIVVVYGASPTGAWAAQFAAHGGAKKIYWVGDPAFMPTAKPSMADVGKRGAGMNVDWDEALIHLYDALGADAHWIPAYIGDRNKQIVSELPLGAVGKLGGRFEAKMTSAVPIESAGAPAAAASQGADADATGYAPSVEVTFASAPKAVKAHQLVVAAGSDAEGEHGLAQTAQNVPGQSTKGGDGMRVLLVPIPDEDRSVEGSDVVEIAGAIVS